MVIVEGINLNEPIMIHNKEVNLKDYIEDKSDTDLLIYIFYELCFNLEKKYLFFNFGQNVVNFDRIHISEKNNYYLHLTKDRHHKIKNGWYDSGINNMDKRFRKNSIK